MDMHLADAKSAIAEAAYDVLQDKQDSLRELGLTAILTFGFKMNVEQQITMSIDFDSLISEGKKEAGKRIEDNQENIDIERFALNFGFKKNAKKLFEDFKSLFEEMSNCAQECSWKSRFESDVSFSIELKCGKKDL